MSKLVKKWRQRKQEKLDEGGLSERKSTKPDRGTPKNKSPSRDQLTSS